MAYPYYQPSYQPFNPYGGFSSAGAQNQSYQQQTYQGQITRVNGRNGADALRLAPNSSVLLMDENDPIVWLKVTDGAGYATVTPYSIAPYQAATPVDVNGLEARVKRLEDKLNGKSDDANANGRETAE